MLPGWLLEQCSEDCLLGALDPDRTGEICDAEVAVFGRDGKAALPTVLADLRLLALLVFTVLSLVGVRVRLELSPICAKLGLRFFL